MFCTTHQIVTTVEPPEICRNDSNIYDVLKFEKKHQKSEIKMPNGPPSQIFNEKATFLCADANLPTLQSRRPTI